MIFSSINSNWEKILIIHNIAKKLFNKTKDSDFRKYGPIQGKLLFDPEVYELMKKESCIVEMIIAWSVFTIESVINHVLVENIDDDKEKIKAIEMPKDCKYYNQIDGVPKYSSQLTQKIIILYNKIGTSKSLNDIIVLTEEISSERNSIVHDKPFEYNEYRNGDISIEYYNSKKKWVKKSYNYTDLYDFYQKCDTIINFILKINKVDIESSYVDTSVIRFDELM